MTHLTAQEIIDFVSFDKLTDETIALSKKVNEHILSCTECFEKVSAFQQVYEELGRIDAIADPRRCVYQIIEDARLAGKQDARLNQILASLDENTLGQFLK